MKKCNVIAHRGANEHAPQNTLPAFRKAIELGCDGFETDIHLTKDGVPVVCHNFTVDETSNGMGEIEQMTFQELRKLDFGCYRGSEYEGTLIPTLDEFLAVYASAADKMNVLDIELKSKVFGEANPEIARITIERVKAFGLMEHLLISSFDPELLMECKNTDENCKTAILYSPDTKMGWKIAPHAHEFARNIGCSALHPMYLYVTPRYVEKAHKMGLQVNPWTVDNENVAARLLKYGVDGLITNLPDKMNHVIEKA